MLEASHGPISSQDAKQLATLASVGRSTSTCPSCKGPQPSYTRLGIGIERTWEANAEFEDEDERDLANSPFDATKVHTILRHITDDDIAHLGLSPDHSRPESMLLTHLLIPSTVIRPSVTVDDGSRTRGQDDLTHKLNDVLKTNALVREAILAKDEEATARHIEALQLHLCLYFDKDASTAVQQAQRRPTPRTGQCRSLASRMRGKRGRVRGNMMGKRVDFSSRSVITGDARMDLDEVGVPMMVALTQTIPELVTRFNIDKLQARVRKGAKRLDGAHAVLSGDPHCPGPVRAVPSPGAEGGRHGRRYLQSGDWVVFNRQPSLHKGSMMGHRARIMPIGRSFAYLCPAPRPTMDFDGDEMNLHVDLGGSSRSAASHGGHQADRVAPSQCAHHRMHPGRPARRLETHISKHLPRAGPLLRSHHGGPFRRSTRARACHLRPSGGSSEEAVYGRPDDELPAPAHHLLVRKRSIWWRHHHRGRRVHVGQAQQEGPGQSAGGIVHLTTLDVGPKRAMEFLSDIQRLVCVYMQGTGETIGLGDCLVDAATHDKIHQAVTGIVDAVKREFPHGPKNESEEMSVTRTLNSALDEAGQIVLKAMDRDNGFKACVDSGSKGSKINLAQVSGCVGQVCVTGKRILPPPVAELFHATPPTTTSFPMGSARTLTC